MERAMFCPRCGARAEGSKFCRSCGTNLAVISEAISAPQQTRRFDRTPGGGMTMGLFNSVTVSNGNRQIDGHNAAAVFGNVTIDLTGVPLADGLTKISAVTVFGETKIFVPDDVGIRISGFSTFSTVKVRGQSIGSGLFDVKDYVSPGYDQTIRRLHVEVTSIFGGVKIRR